MLSHKGGATVAIRGFFTSFGAPEGTNDCQKLNGDSHNPLHKLLRILCSLKRDNKDFNT